MREKRHSFWLILIILAATLLYASSAHAQGATGFAAVAEAHRARWAARQNWRGAVIAQERAVYDLRAALRYYAYSVERDGAAVGYIIVSAPSRNVVEFAAGPHPLFADESLRACAGQVVRTAPGVYMCRRPTGEIVDPRAGDVVHAGALIPVAPDMSTARAVDVAPQHYLAPRSASTAVIIPNVPDIQQYQASGCWSGCGPASAANLVSFWAQTYPELIPGTLGEMMESLRMLMGTWCSDGMGYTIVASISEGLEDYTREQEYIPVASHHVTDTSFALYRAEIDAGHPTVIGFLHPAYSAIGHMVTGVGYDEDGGGWFVVHNNARTPEGFTIYPPNNVLLTADKTEYDFLEFVFYEVQGAMYTEGTNAECKLPQCMTLNPLEYDGHYTFTFKLDNTCHLTPTDYFQCSIALGVGCAGVYTQCANVDTELTGGHIDGPFFIDINTPTLTMSYTFQSAMDITITEPLSDVCIFASGGAICHDGEGLWPDNLQVTRTELVPPPGRPITPCRAEDPNLDSPDHWKHLGDVTFANGAVRLENGSSYGSATYTGCYVLNNDLVNPFWWGAYSDQFAGNLEFWADYTASQLEFGAGKVALDTEERLYQHLRLPAGTYTMTVNAKASDAVTVPLWLSLSRYRDLRQNTVIVSATDYTDYAWSFTVSENDFTLQVGRKDALGGRAVVNAICLEGPPRAYTEVRAAAIWQPVLLPNYAMLSMEIVARTNDIGTILHVYKDNALAGRIALGTNWSTYGNIKFVNEFMGPRDIRVTFQSDNPDAWVELDYICVRRDDDLCLPWLDGVGGGPRNPSFEDHETSGAYEVPSYWRINQSGTLGEPAQWISTEETLFPSGLIGYLQDYAPSVDQEVMLKALDMRVSLQARLLNEGEPGLIFQDWIYESNSGMPGSPDLIRAGAQVCEVESADRQSCVFENMLNPAFSLQWGNWDLLFSQNVAVAPGTPTPVPIVIDDVCVQIVSIPDIPPTNEPDGGPQPPGPGTPTATPTEPSGGPQPTDELTPWPTLRATWTPNPLTPTPDPITPWPTQTPWPTPTPRPTSTPGAADTNTPPPTTTGEPSVTPHTATPMPTLTSFPLPTPQPTPADETGDCCTYCVYWNTETDTLATSGSTSCDGCGGCDTPTAPEAPRGWDWTNFGAWFQWIAGWIGWLGGWITWLVCKLYYVILCPIICFSKAWLWFGILWLKANTIDFLLNLLGQIAAAFWAALGVLWAALGLLWEVLVLLFSVIGLLAGQVAAMITAMGDTSAVDLSLLDDNLLACLWGEFEWFVWNSPAQLFLYLFYVDKTWDFVEWALAKLSDVQ